MVASSYRTRDRWRFGPCSLLTMASRPIRDAEFGEPRPGARGTTTPSSRNHNPKLEEPKPQARGTTTPSSTTGGAGRGDGEEGVGGDQAVAGSGAGEPLRSGGAPADGDRPDPVVVADETARVQVVVGGVGCCVDEPQRGDRVDAEVAAQEDLRRLHRERVSAAAAQMLQVEPTLVVVD